MKNLITAEEVKNYGRPIGRMVDNDKLTAFITEAEQLHVKPIIGNALYLRLVRDLEKPDEERDPLLVKLLDGGTYEVAECGCDEEEEFFFEGLKVAISYFVYAQNVMSGDFESTRYGMVIKQDDYSSHLSDKNRSDNYNNVLDMANGYLQECVTYCKAVGLIKSVRKPTTNFGGVTIRRIG